MLTTFHHACATGKISTNPKISELINDHHLKTLIESSKRMQLLSGESIEANQFLIDQALSLHAFGIHKKALEILAKIKINKVLSDQIIQQKGAIDYYTCMISAQDDVLSGRIKFEESFDHCQMGKGEKVKVLNTNQNVSVLKSSEINIYSNPTKDLLNLEIPTNSDGQIGLEILDIQGRQMVSSQPTISTSTKTSKYQVNIRDLPEGIFFVRLKIEEQYYFQKIIKQ